MKKILLAFSLSFIAIVSFSQINIIAYDSLGNHDCDSSQVFLYNETPLQTPAVYYQWDIDGVDYNVGTNQAPLEVFVSNSDNNYVTLNLYSDSNYTSIAEDYSFLITIDSCSITNLYLGENIDNLVSCSEAWYSIDAFPVGGTAPYTYIWSVYQGATLLNSYTDLGNYFTELLHDGDVVEVVVVDANGYSYTESTQVNIYGNVYVEAVSSVVSSDCSNSVIQFDAITNFQSTLYTWDIEYNGVVTTYTTPTLSITVPNSAQIVSAIVTITDPNDPNCFVTDVIDVSVNSTGGLTLVSDVINNSPTPCFPGQCEFEILVTPTSGTGPYLYALDSNALDSSNVFSTLCVGTYIVTVEDANGCTSSISVVVEDSQALQVYESSYFASCDSGNTSGNNSYMQAYASNATTVWSDGYVGSTYNDPEPGTYNYIVTDQFTGCTSSGTFEVPSNNCYTISGNVYADLDGDCVFNNDDYEINSVWVDLADSLGNWLWVYDYTDSDGYYSITAGEGTYYFDVNGNNVTGFTQDCPASGFSVTIGPNNPNPVVDFFLTPPPPVQDLSVSIYSFTTFTPGFPYWAYVTYCNPGTVPMSGTVVMNYDANLTYVDGSSAGAVNDPVNQTLTWTFTDLNPSQCGSFYPDFVCSVGAALGDVMSNTVVVNPIAGDVTPANNTAYVSEVVVGSWDPNDKAVSPQADMTLEEKDHDYTIRFQNKGTAPATFVIVRDDLDDNLDLQTIRNVSASHNFVMTVENTDELVFTFNNIMLPAEQDDTTGSNGSIHFTISQKENLPVGTVIENTAAIYFDFNEPVITNTTVNTIVEKTTDIKDVNQSARVNVYPNPNNGLFNVSAATKIKAISVYDLVGKVIFEVNDLNNEKAMLNLEKAVSGVYLLKTETENGVSVNKITISNN